MGEQWWGWWHWDTCSIRVHGFFLKGVDWALLQVPPQPGPDLDVEEGELGFFLPGNSHLERSLINKQFFSKPIISHPLKYLRLHYMRQLLTKTSILCPGKESRSCAQDFLMRPLIGWTKIKLLLYKKIFWIKKILTREGKIRGAKLKWPSKVRESLNGR